MIEINENLLRRSEKISLMLRGIYRDNGYAPYQMSKFEEYDLYAGNKDFLVSDNVITFTDTSGKLMALKPDVTLSIIKNSRIQPGDTCRVYYDENVYRVSRSTGSFREIMQSGVECFGQVSEEDLCQVLTMAVRTLRALDPDCVLAVSCLDILKDICDAMPGVSSSELLRCIEEKSTQTAASLCPPCAKTALLRRLLTVKGTLREALPELDSLFGLADEKYNRFRSLLSHLPEEAADFVTVDFSLTGDVNYYNGIVFRGFIRNIPTAVLSGGQYDTLLRKLRPEYSALQNVPHAIGFAVYTDSLDTPGAICHQNNEYVNIALPKGRLGEKVYAMFAAAGYECPSILEQNRRLVFEVPEKHVRYFWVKPSDVAIYVERGAADIGVAGKDILLEYAPDIYELLDLNTGICRMAVAAPKRFSDDNSRTLTVATKYPAIAKKYYRGLGREIDIVRLNGSIELAPLLGLSDVIVDIVETGTTLKENDLQVLDTIVPISARLIANKSSFKFKQPLIDSIVNGLNRIKEAKA